MVSCCMSLSRRQESNWDPAPGWGAEKMHSGFTQDPAKPASSVLRERKESSFPPPASHSVAPPLG